ncbi:MAG TPA: ImcF-related family protein [Bryobacteraceae bacterium]|nr:ImcF-related family protein [Bryobacteraceae bacterium]
MAQLAAILGVSLLLYMAAAWAAGKMLGLSESDFYLLYGVLVALGVMAAAVFVWWKMRQQQEADNLPADAPLDPTNEVDAIVREAEAKLAASTQVGKGASISTLPVVLVLGEPGTAKTSTILNSGLEPELLAGVAHQDNQVAATRTANFWLAKNTVFAEAGAPLLAEQSRWVRLVRRLKPGSLKSVVGGNAHAPRAAVVCVNAEVFTQQGAAEYFATVARNTQARLGEVSQALGISFPVYVLFTRCDRLPFFTDYVRGLTNEEAGQVLGITLPMSNLQAGVYAEEQTRRLTASFDSLFYSLSDKRLHFLPREGDPQKVPGAYEFPREFRKLRNAVVQFLVDVARPSQLRTSPFLRGFYFSGVRPVAVQDTPLPSASAPSAKSAQAAGHATGMFAAMRPGAVPQAAPQPQYVGTKRVPQWVFVSRLFNQVILQDRAALAASGSSTKTSGLQRMLLIAGTLALFFLAIGFTVSYFKNRAMVNDAVAAAEAISSSEAAGTNLASVDSLQKLETLRKALEQLTAYRVDGRPFSMGLGLFAGDDLYPHLRKTYYNRFGQLLFTQAQGSLVSHLQRLPAAPAPTDDYNLPYQVLKGYLITTVHNDKVTDDSPAPILLSRWAEGRNVDVQRMDLAKKQFVYYAKDLKNGNPFSSQGNNDAVARGRSYLAQFSGIERVYQFMLSKAGKGSVNFNRDVANSAQAVVNNKDVPAAFTKTGYQFMSDNLPKADQFFAGERWVLCDAAGNISASSCQSGSIDKVQLTRDLSTRYVNDYIAQWRAYFRNSAVLRYSDLKDAASKLNLQSGTQSPILGLFWLASQHTGVDFAKIEGADRIQKAFQSVHHVVPPANVDRYVAPSNQPYMNALLTLQTSIDQAAQTPVPDPMMASSTLSNASSAKISVKQVAQGFNIDPETHLETTLQKLLEDPITNAEGLLRGLGPAELNAKGKGLCGQFSAVTNKYPFNPAATAEASIAEVNSLLKPGEGALWAFYDANLKAALAKQGSQYVPTGTLPLTPQFVGFFNTAAKLSEALYKPGAADPKLMYTLTPLKSEGIQSVTLNIDGQTLTASGNGGSGKQFTWPGGGQAALSGKFGGPDLGFFSYTGTWAAFRLMGDAERWEPSGAGYNLEWVVRVGGKAATLPSGATLTVRFQLDTGGAPVFFKKGSLAGLRCVSQVAK